MRGLRLLLVVGALGGCHFEPSGALRPESRAVELPAAIDEEEAMRQVSAYDLIMVGGEVTRRVRRCDLVLVGRVVGFGPPPQIWSGVAVAYQAVEVAVEDVVHGQWPLERAAVHWVVVAMSPTAGPADESPGLNPAAFPRDTALIFTAKIAAYDDHFYGLYHNLEWLPPLATPENIARIETALAGLAEAEE